VDNFYETVTNIYKEEQFEDYMNTHVFDELKSTISSDIFSEFDELVKKFNLNTPDKFKVNGDFMKVYKPEV
jgi:hypothetical protein